MRRISSILFLAAALGACGSPKPATGGRGGSGGGEGGSGGSAGSGCADTDGDGYSAKSCGGTDCDDDSDSVFPATRELCKDGIDQNCDGAADEGCDCTAGDMRPCWSGHATTRGVGACADGWQRCDRFGAWSVCSGEVAPSVEPAACDGIDQDCDGADVGACAGCGAAEICGNGLDDDCALGADGPATCGASCLPAEGLLPACCGTDSCPDIGCDGRAGQNCYTGSPGTLGKGVCHAGRADCEGGAWGSCEGEVTPGVELCGNGLDDDCDGLIDESDAAGRRCPRDGCGDEVCGNGLDDDCDGYVDEACAADAAEQPCYPGAASTLNRGVCRNGVQKRQEDDFWGPCTGAITPSGERCGDALDTDCNGRGGPGQAEDSGCCVAGGDETCNGADDDCDGLVDEDFLSSCGDCAMSCPGSLELSDLAVCERTGRSCSDLVPAAGGGLTVDGGAVVGGDTGFYFYVDLTTLRRIDTSTGKKNYDYTFPGGSAGIYAACLDGTLWLHEQDQQTVVHLSKDGKVICSYSDPPRGTLAIAADETCAAWMTWGDPRNVLKLPADSYAGEPARCIPEKLGETTDTLDVGIQLTQLVVGPAGALWGVGFKQAGVRIDRETLAVTPVTLPDPGGHQWFSLPAVDDEGGLWFGPTDGSLVRIAPDDDGSNPETHSGVFLTDLLVGKDGLIWGTKLLTNELASFDPATGKVNPVAFPQDVRFFRYPTLDTEGRIWALASRNLGADLQRYDPDLQRWDRYEDQVPNFRGVETVSSRSATTLQRFQGGSGSFTQDVDGGSAATAWTSLTWTADVPDGARLHLWARFASNPAGLSTSSACGPFTASPADLATCGAGEPPKARYLRVQADLQNGTAAPELRGITVEYARP